VIIEGASGFWSYVRQDDEAVGRRMTRLARLVQAAYGLITGEELELFVDRTALEWGDAWRERIDVAIAGTTFFIPVLTPRYFESSECRQELLKFLGEAKRGGVEQLLLPVYYVTVSELEDEPTDELMIAVKERQWEDLRDIRLLDEESGSYRAAVDRLARRIAKIAQTVGQVPDVPASESDSGGPEDDESDGQDDESLGMIEKLGEGEQALNELSGTLEAMSAENKEVGDLAIKATQAIQESDQHNRGFAGRMAIAQRYAKSLQTPAAHMQELGQKYTSQLMKVHAMTTTILEIAEGDRETAHEVAGFLRSVVGLSEAAAGAVESTRELVRSLQENAKLSRSLRPPTRQITAGLQAFVDGEAIIAEWADRAGPVLAGVETEG
jgi:TIR domain